MLAAAFALALPAQAQTFTVLHSFTGGQDGGGPMAGVTLDAGNLYGTAFGGGNTGGDCPSGGCGTVYKLKPSGSRWILDPLYSFHGDDGMQPIARVVFGPDGTLYGTTL
jgi:hypothetical protein